MNPSNANRRVACPGSYALEKQYPNLEESQAMREGKAALWVAMKVLNGEHEVGHIAPNGEPISKEMLEGADLLWDCIHEVINRPGIHPVLHLEEPLDISNVHPGLHGIPNSWCVKDNELFIWEYKFGHAFVDAFENWQLIEYAAGIYEIAHFNKVTLAIVQPRSYHPSGFVRSWSLDIKQLQEYIELAQDAESRASGSLPLQRPGSHCSHCSGRQSCVTLQQTALTAVDISLENSPWGLSPMQTGNELRYLKHAAEALDARISGLSEQARSMITRGEFVPGFRLESSSGREKWTKEPEEIITLGELMGFNLAKPSETITPSQAKKLGLDSSLVEEYSQRVPGSLKLVEIKDSKKTFGSS